MTVIAGISALKKRPRVGLLSVATPLPATDEEGRRLDWRRGIDYVPEGCHAPDAVPFCDDDIEKPRIDPQAAVRFDPFGIVSTDGCNDPWYTNEDFFNRADRVLQMGQSSILARELEQSTVTTNPDLQGTAVDLTGAMPTPVALEWKEAATVLIWNMRNAGYVGDVWIHAPTFLEPAFGASNIGDTDSGTRQAYIGKNPVIFDAGYSGFIGPGGLPEGSNPATPPADPPNTGWVYATGPVEYAFGELLPPDPAGDNRLNDRFVAAERGGILRFDPCQVFGVLVEVC